MADDDTTLPAAYDLVPVDHQPQFADAPIPKAGQTVQQPNVMGDISSMPGKVASAVGDVTGVTDAYKAATGQMTPDEAQMFALGALPMLAGGPEAKVAGEVASDIAPGIAKGIRAYHGSPYDFNQFDLSKIGTGEGAQAYGHGVYLAENPSTADVYRKTLSLKGQAEPQAVKAALGDAVPYDPQIANAIRSVAMSEPDPTRAAFLLQSRVPDLRDEGMSMLDNDAPKRQALSKAIALEQEAIKGHMYEVNINADPEHFLDWDKPLSEQSPKVQEALSPLVDKIRGAGQMFDKKLGPNPTGEQVYSSLGFPSTARAVTGDSAGFADKSNATTVFRDAGIPGIKYLDQGSRIGGDAGKMIDNYGSREKALEVAQQRLKSAGMGDLRYWDGVVNQLKTPQTNNFVVFNDKLIDIIKKYGLAGLVAGGASHFSTVPVDHQPDFGDQQQGMATGGGVKATKTQANYRGGNKDARCYMCTMFVRPDGCTAVQGKISARGLCDFFEPKGKKKNTVKIDAAHDGPWMSCMSIDGSTMYRNRNIPATANVKGKTVDVDDMLLHHEVPERADLEKLIAEFKERFHREPNTRERKGIYLKAHNRSGTPNERAHAKKIGVDWKAWSAWCRGEESKIEKMKFTNEPKDADVKPIPHSHGDLEAVGSREAA